MTATTLNPYYAHDSSVGPVFDVAHYSPFKDVRMGLVGLLFAAMLGAAAAYFWNPDWILADPPEWIAEVNGDAKELMHQHPTGVKIGVGAAALFSLIFIAAGMSCLVNAGSGNYYIRVGERGMSVRMSDAFFSTFQHDLEWSQITKLKVVQEKYFGSLSRSAGNIGGEIQICTCDGVDRTLRLDSFREDAWLIYQRMEEARNTRPAVLA